jgi:glutaminyl-tRNA synthetase
MHQIAVVLLPLVVGTMMMRLPGAHALKVIRRQMVYPRLNINRQFSVTSLANSESTSKEEVTQSGMIKNFISNIIEEDIRNGKYGGRVITRFPPEPNGYLHLGHAKSVNFNFAVASAYGGVTNMRFDDTNPAKEDLEYVHSILDDVRWLITGKTSITPPPWDGPVRNASSYFQVLYDAAEYLILQQLAYVDDLSLEQMREYRGTLTTPGKDSPFRNRGVEDNLRLFRAMRDGEFPDGHCVLRAKIDMASPNLNMRDPTLYRIKRAEHPVTGNKWCIYPMYDFAHALSDALEGITHSLCTLEFADHRPLYDWSIDKVMPSGLLPYQKEGWRPNQYEFSRLNIQYSVLSKRKLIQLVQEKHVQGWDDPRMPTISGMRRRGYPSSALRLFCDRVGISKAESNIDMSVLEDCVRETLDETALRVFGIEDPLKVTIVNRPEVTEEVFEVPNHPKRAELGNKSIYFGNELFISRADFFDTGVDGSISPPKGYKRLLPGGQVRLKYAYVLTCQEVIRDAEGNVTELLCTYDTSTRAGSPGISGKKVKGIIQWLSAKHALPVQLNQYDRLFCTPSPGSEHADKNFLRDLNPNSWVIVPNAMVEDTVSNAGIGDSFQFERVGYFAVDKDRTKDNRLIFNKVVSLKDTWAAKA